MKILGRCLWVLVLVNVTACAWIKPSENSAKIELVTQQDVLNCVNKGRTHAKTLSKILFFPRSKSKVAAELLVLAKNEALVMKGDVVIAETKIQGGAQTFAVYQCQGTTK